MKKIIKLVFAILFFTQLCFAQAWRVENITKETGLLHDYVLSVFEDHEGFIWIGTYGGLQRYDGNEMVYFTHDEQNKTSISNNSVHAIFEDQQKRLWIGAENGLNLFDPVSLSFKTISPDNKPFKTAIRSIVQQANEMLWIGTYGGGLLSYELDKNRWTTYQNEPSNPNSLPSNFVNILYVDSKDRVCVGTESGGFSILNSDQKTFTNYGKANGISDNTVASILEDTSGNYWIGTWQGGLNFLDAITGRFSQANNLPKTISKGVTIRSICPNKDGTMWLATQNGLVLFAPKTNKAITHRNISNNGNSLPFNYIWSLFKDRNNILWIGTFGGGLAKFNQLENRFKLLTASEGDCQLENEHVTSMFQDSKNRMWVATVGDGIRLYESTNDCSTGKLIKSFFSGQKVNAIFEDSGHAIWCEANGIVHRFSSDLKTLTSVVLAEQGILGFTIYTFAEDKNGNLWMGGWNTGLIKLTKAERTKNKNLRFEVIRNKENSGLTSDIVWSILADGDVLWIGTGLELVKYDLQTNCFSPVTKGFGANVYNFYKQSADKLWFGTTGRGLYYLDIKASKIHSFKHNDQLTNLSILAMAGSKDEIWFSTDRGLFRVDLKNEHLHKYTIPDGLSTNAFLFHSFTQLKNKHLLFGTPQGIVDINPSNSATNTILAKPIITDFKLFGRSVSLEHGLKKDQKLALSLSDIKTIQLLYSENAIEIDFSSIQFTANVKTAYRYKLEGFDKMWYTTTTDKRQATYTNLDAGEYTFKVKVANSDGFWNEEEATLRIVISPPWWQTWWFRILLVALIIGLIYAYLHFRTRRIILRNQELELEVNLRTRDLQEANDLLTNQNIEISRKSDRILEQQQELLSKKTELESSNVSLESSNNLKNMLFSVIAHDVRNPVNNFLALIQIAKTVATKEIQEILGQAEKQATNLSQMTTSLLDWAVFQSQKSELEKQVVNPKEICQEIAKELAHNAETKRVNIEITVLASLHVLCDKNALKTVIRNLCSNAIKFTPLGGKVELIAELESDKVFISVKDNGTGIETEKLETIFQFIPNKKTRGTSGELGSGVGLVFSYELNKLNGGEMTVESELGKGSVFRLTFPYYHKEIELNDIVLLENPLAESIAETEVQDLSEYKNILKGKVVFLIDDDDVHRQHLNSYLCDVVEIYEFPNAEEAWKQAQTVVPDLMVIDLNLPGMSGFELSKLVKSTENTSDITCIILTGETRPEWIAMGFEYGVDAYVTKPYNKKVLLEKITHYFQQQQNRIKRYLLESDITISSITNNPLNQAFLEKLVLTIEARFSESDFNAEVLCEELGMSRSSLYRKLKSLTNESVNDFIRSVRLKKSLELLKQKQLNISQVAYEVGFNSLSYFTSSFKKHFGFSPSDVGKGK